MTVLDLKRVISPFVRVKYVTYNVPIQDIPYYDKPEVEELKHVALEDEIQFITVLDYSTIEVTI